MLFDGVFYAAGKLCGPTFKERHDLPVYEPGVRVFAMQSHGGSAAALTLFRDLTAGAPDTGPLLKKRGLDAAQ